MRCRGILLDLDDTLYDYGIAHAVGYSAASRYASESLGIDVEAFGKAYGKARESVHRELDGTAASHNRLIYFQRALELLGVNPLAHALDCYSAYWDTFLGQLSYRPGVVEFLDMIQDREICLVTDLTAHIQYRKIRRMGLHERARWLVTGEEAGCEKPAHGIFALALKKMGLAPEDACMIGDSYEKDAMGALRAGIRPYWLNAGNDVRAPDANITVVADFEQLAEHFR